jgi:hypothetical protein
MTTIAPRQALAVLCFLVLPLLFQSTLAAAELPVNTWVRLADCPGDAEGREVPPGRGSTWVYCPPLKSFLRYGGYTPRFSNALDQFDPATKKWTRLLAEDENYPTNRPGGACEVLLAWDAKSNCLWIAGGQTRADTGVRGIWCCDPAKLTFRLEAVLPRQVSRLAFDTANRVFVASPPPASDGDQGATWIYPLASQKWERKPTSPLPQAQYGGHFPIVYDPALGRCVAVGNGVWSFDAASNRWEQLTSNTPPWRAFPALAYDPDARSVMLFGGGSDNGNGDYGQWGKVVKHDTWYFHAGEKTWREVKTPGPVLTIPGRGGEVTFRFGLTHDPGNRCMTLMDADLGVWQFRYDPKAAPGAACVSNGFVAAIGAAATNPPIAGPREIRVPVPTPPNPRLLEMADNTVVRLRNGLIGDEIAWTYDSDAGVFLKYGGCGNSINPYWAHYGNDLTLFDPGTEKTCVRRVSDVSGGARPGNGCTRTMTYDAKRKLTWTFGTVGSGPYMSAPPQPGPGYYRYGISNDVFTFATIKEHGAPAFAQNCYLAWSPDFDLAIFPDNQKTHLFDFATATWSTKPSPDSPGGMGVYERLAYVASKKGYLRIASVPTGRTSVEKPADAIPAEQAAGKQANYWIKDDKAKLWKELTLATYLYSPAANTWTDLKPPQNPPYRNCKYGLAYDSKNDVVILVGGAISWNGPHCKDLWAYDVKRNAWTKIETTFDGKPFATLGENLMADYDTRHNVVIFRAGWSFWAYRFKK